MTFAFIGTIIGAGFASGQEIKKYFVDYGMYGFFGIILMSVLFMIIGQKILVMGYVSKSDSYERVLGYGFRCKFKRVIDFVLCLFLVLTAGVMFSGAGAFFDEVFDFNPAFGSLLMMIVSFAVTIVGIGGIVKISNVIVPILIVITSTICVYSLRGVDFSNVNYVSGVGISQIVGGLISFIVYVGYNFILSIPVLVTLGNSSKNTKEIKVSSILAGLFIGVFASILFFAMLWNYNNIQGAEIPILSITSSDFFLLYGISFIISVFTTAVGTLIGVYSRFNKNKLLLLFACIFAYIFSLFGFSNLVANLYFVMGIFGVFIICMLIYGFGKSSSLGKVN